MYRHEGDPPTYAFESMQSPRVAQAVFTRLGGASRGAFASLNVGHTVGDDPTDVEANHETICRILGISADEIVTAHQVHGHRVARVSRDDGGTVVPETDALITNDPGVVLLLRFADCTPVLISAPSYGAVGIAHAGWRGTVQRIAALTVRAMCEAFGCRPSDCFVGIGPAIGACCYQVGPEVVADVHSRFSGADLLFSHRTPDGRAHLDMALANEMQLREIGVTHIEASGLCTRCHRDEFFSYRGDHGHTGRFAACIGLRSAATQRDLSAKSGNGD